MTGQGPKIDFENIPAPAKGILVTHFLIVREVARSRAFYADVLGGQVVIEENPCIVELANGWIIMNPGWRADPRQAEHLGRLLRGLERGFQLPQPEGGRYRGVLPDRKAKGADFVTEPIDRGAEVRCYMRDPDGYLIEVGQATGMRGGKLAKKRPEDLPG